MPKIDVGACTLFCCIFAAVLFLFFQILFFLIYKWKIIGIRKEVKMLKRRNAEITMFMQHFSADFSGQNSNGNSRRTENTAKYMAELIEAEAVCIFMEEEGKASFRAVSLFGNFPLLGKQNKYTMSKKEYIVQHIVSHPVIFGKGFLGEVARTQRWVKIDDSQDLMLKDFTPVTEIQGVMAGPLLQNGRTVGIICAVNSKRNAADENKTFQSDQFERFKFIAEQVLIAENIIRAYSENSKFQRFTQELEFARSLQISMLPKEEKTWGNFVIQAKNVSAKEVSGDFYDFIEIDNNRLLVVIGDATGKGVPACLISSMARSFIRAHLAHFTTLKNLLCDVNKNLEHDLDIGQYITLGICLLDCHENTLEYARAGHTELVVYIHQHLRIINPDGPGLGLLSNDFAEFDTICVQYQDDMELLLFSDGITEARNHNTDEMFGINRLSKVFHESCLKENTPPKTIDSIFNEVHKFSGELTPADDQTVVVIGGRRKH